MPLGKTETWRQGSILFTLHCAERVLEFEGARVDLSASRTFEYGAVRGAVDHANGEFTVTTTVGDSEASTTQRHHVALRDQIPQDIPFDYEEP